MFLSAVETAQAVRSGQVTPLETVAAALDRIEQLNPRLNAFEVVLRAQALADAAALTDHDGPLAGVPVAVKAEVAVAGLPTTFGGRGNSTPATEDSELVRRLRAAGAVIVGTTLMPEFGQFPFTESAAHGSTANPHSVDHSPGGSSGGSAAAVASGMVPVAIGGDGGGSIRIPASCCGLVGLKPLRGRVSTSPYPDLWGALGTAGPLTRTVLDSALVYDVISGSTSVDRWQLPTPHQSFVRAAQTPPNPLRIGWLTQPALGPVRVAKEVVASVRALVDTLAGLGHELIELDTRWPDVQAAFVPQFFGAIRDELTRVEHPERTESRTRATARMGTWARPAIVAAAERRGEALREQVEQAFADVDVVLTPTLACLPPRLGQLDGVGSTHALISSMPMIAFTTLANVTGHAAISIPGRPSGSGLPIGVQLMAPAHDEALLLSLAHQVERS